jgi:hypothetical protein
MKGWMVLMVFLAGCSFDKDSTPQGDQSKSSSADIGGGTTAPNAVGKKVAVDPSEGDWRLASELDLQRAMIRASHILVRHVDSLPEQVPFVFPDWKALPKPPHRSRTEALRIAQGLRERARADVTTFRDLAAQYSEDTTSSSIGGALGVRSALLLSHWPEVLDALAATETGQISDIVETEAGFHIFKQELLPPLETLSARHLVIGHARAPLLTFARRQEHPQAWRERDMEEANALATRLADELRANPERFDALVREYSDHWDAEQGGDVGSWSRLETGPYAQAFELVAEAAIGEIVGPVQTFYGYSVWQRTLPSPRTEYATQGLRLNYNPEAAADDPNSRSNVELRAQRILSDLKANLALFPSLFEQYGEDAQRWRQGRGRRGMDHLVATTEIGAIAESTVEVENAFFVLVRVDPTTVPLSLPPLARLPEPTKIALAYYFARLNGVGRRELLERSARACGLTDVSRVPGVVEELAALEEKLAARIVVAERQRLSDAFLKRIAVSLALQSECVERELDTGLREVFLPPKAQ